MSAKEKLLERVARRARDIYYSQYPTTRYETWEQIDAFERNAWMPHASAAIEAVAEIATHDLLGAANVVRMEDP